MLIAGIVAAAAGPAAAELPAGMSALLDAAEDHDAEVVRFAEGQPGGAALVLATRVAAEPGRLIASLAEPATYQRAVPAFVKAEVRETGKTVAGGQAGPDRLIAWELEVPLWNFAGTLWLRPHAKGVVLELVGGDLAPGRLVLTVLPAARAGGRATLSVAGTVAIEKANFVTRRLAARDPLAATAMRATAFAVLLRALALDAVRTGDRTSPRRRPTVPIPVPPEPTGPAPALPVWSAWAAAAPEGNAAFAVVKSRASGRLDRVSVGLPVAAAADRAQAALVQLASWRGLPGWRDIEAGGAPGAVTWTVDSGLPFVDFDAVWSILEAPGRPGAQGFRAQARGGDWVGPTIGVDLLPRTGSRSVMVYTTTPLINRTGYLPRRLIEAEPLLEQGLALGLAFVNARSLTRGLASLAGR